MLPDVGFIVVPSMNQMFTSPVAVLRHNRSALPSPSKSPVPRMTQLGSATLPMLSESGSTFWLNGSRSHTFTSPVTVLRQKRSRPPSPFASDLGGRAIVGSRRYPEPHPPWKHAVGVFAATCPASLMPYAN